MDIDADGDKDYIYMLGGSLYIKYNHEKSPARFEDSSIATVNLDPNLFPEVPNFFRENIASP